MFIKQVQRVSNSYSLFYVSNDVVYREIPWCSSFLGKRKLKLGFEDQKIDFDLFVEDKPAPEYNVCLQVMGEGQEVLKLRTKT